MITQTLNISKEKSAWQTALMQSIRDPHELASLLELEVDQINSQFPLKVPRGFVAKMKKGDPNDPLLLQILPSIKEEIISEGFSLDPLEESKSNPRSGIIHKYKNRVLLTLSSCAVHCRYCFRRYFPYSDNHPSLKMWDKELDYIREHPEVVEVILSGGDPLMSTDRFLSQLLEKLETIPHLKYLRIHSRIPIVLPERIDENCLAWLKQTRFKTTLVVHCNHPRELCEQTAKAVQNLKSIGITVLNQSVLLKGVNDNLETLKELSFALYDQGILPYYIHMLDQVQGSEHFRVDDAAIKHLTEKLPAELQGYLLPRFVRTVPGAASKVVVR
jgi:EF-P beta-lysylation protein EpmB